MHKYIHSYCCKSAGQQSFNVWVLGFLPGGKRCCSGGGSPALCWCTPLLVDTGKMRRKSAAGRAGGGLRMTGWLRLAGSVEVQRPAPAGAACWSATLGYVTAPYTVLCCTARITRFILGSLFSSERGMTQKFCRLGLPRRREERLLF